MSANDLERKEESGANGDEGMGNEAAAWDTLVQHCYFVLKRCNITHVVSYFVGSEENL